MPQLTQKDRRLVLTTPLGEDVLLIRSVRGREAVSSLFSYEIEAFTGNATDVDFSKLIGKSMTVSIALDNQGLRYLNGIVIRCARGARGFDYTAYRFEIVPTLWLLTKIQQSRIFQQMSVPDILKKVLTGVDVSYETQGTYEPRDYCVQYRETDFAFASRLMEEEGIFYYFKFSDGAHKMVVADAASAHVDMPHMNELTYDEVTGGTDVHERILYWEKVQELRSGKVTLWDHCFELPHKHLETEDTIIETVSVGGVSHKLNVANDKLEIFDYPGAYAQRYDGISPGGGEQASEIQKIFQDNARTVGIRMQQEALPGLVLQARTNFGGITAGHKFKLAQHFSDDGDYVVTEADLTFSQGSDYVSGGDGAEEHFEEVSFRCIPSALPYRPLQLTPKPVIHGTQTAVVTGPSGEEVFTDKYGRVKVQFHWDRQGKYDGSSSCWVRVATLWAGKNFGTVFIPRIGMEVVVAFEEGDPDRPIIVGSVYNADCMPPHLLPDNKTMSGIKTRSSPQAGSDNLNELRFEDKKGEEMIFLNGEKDVDFRTKNDYKSNIGHDFHEKVVGDVKIAYDTNFDSKIGVNSSAEIGADYSLKIKGKSATDISGGHTLKVGSDSLYQSGGNTHIKASGTIKIDGSGAIEITSPAGVTLKCGGNFVTVDPSGVSIKGTMVLINSGGAAMSASAVSALSPTAPQAPTAPLEPGTTALPKVMSGGGGAAAALAAASSQAPPVDSAQKHKPESEENKEKKNWVEVHLVDESGADVPNETVRITLPDGTVAEGTTNEKGKYRVDGIDPGNCTVTFPNLDQDAWKEK
jgi:type VI secretion system secreted protein VgrG